MGCGLEALPAVESACGSRALSPFSGSGNERCGKQTWFFFLRVLGVWILLCCYFSLPFLSAGGGLSFS